MAVKLGYSDLKHLIQTPATWDLAYLKQFSLRDGTTFDQLVLRIATVFALFNQALTQGYWAQYFSVTTLLEKEYEAGGSAGELPEYSELERPDPIIGELTGHMIPMKDYGGSLGWTYLGLRRARRENIDADIRALITRSQNTWARKIMRRLFVSAVDTVGTSGKSLPFADGGAGDAVYAPPTWEGKEFLTTHNHYLRHTADATGRSAALDAMIDTLVEHGYTSPFDLIIPETDIAAWSAQSEFKKPERGILSTAGVEVRAQIPEETYLGVVESERGWARVKYSPRLPTAYAGMFKPTGYNNPTTPLVVRFEEGFPLGLSIVATETKFPLADAIALLTFGVGVGNRTAGAATYFAASGNYVDPVIT